MHTLTCLSPLDGRYHKQTQELAEIFSEFSLMQNRLTLEIEWLIYLANSEKIDHIKPIKENEQKFLQNIYQNFSLDDAKKIKEIENTTKHDVKAIEYFLKEKINNYPILNDYLESIHFTLTSEDCNSIAYALMLNKAMNNIIKPIIKQLITQLNIFAIENKNTVMLSKTHGQAASPTTLGKEILVFSTRLSRQLEQLNNLETLAKCSGAVGNYNAHYVAYPNINWPNFINNFMQSLGITQSPLTTQIEPHDNIAEYADNLSRINNINIDLCQDFWGYISISYLNQAVAKNQVGSSTMPHKINPIDFENAEGNLGIANALLNHFANKLTKSRFQRDLSDSTVMRNIGVALAHSLLAYKSILKGLTKLTPNKFNITNDLDDNWQVLTEAVQTIMRKHKVDQAYEQLKELSQGKTVSKDIYKTFIQNLNIPEYDKDLLLNLTPQSYTGNSKDLEEIIAKLNNE